MEKIKNLGWIKITQIVVFAAILIFVAAMTINFVSKFVSTWEITNLPGLAVSNTETETAAPAEGQTTPGDSSTAPEAVGPETSSAAPIEEIIEPWDGASRVTLLLMGLDYNDWRGNEGPPRTDTMILLTIDPLSKTAGMLSIPRDLWVSIPGFQYGKINTAYQLGEAYKLPGGGPGLAMETVEKLIGVPIQYYAQIDFTAFVRFIDEIGGVKIDIPKKIKIDIYDDPRGKFVLQRGVQTLSGDYALAYARARTTDGSDFDRATRQQQVIMGIRTRLLEFDLLPILIAKAPTLYAELSSGIHTNLSLDESLQLAWLAQQIPTESIYSGIIGTEQVNFGKSPDGLDILKPLPDQVRILRDQIFVPGGALSPVANTADPVTLMIAENATIRILNGTFTPGSASQTAEYLQSLGANVIGTGDAAEKPYPHTYIYDHTGNPYTVAYMVELMGISPYRVTSRFRPDSEVDVTITIGNEWINNNPMP